ncbi:mycothiol synthase [Corynebacterium uterequi]|uniref:Mycothiol acetyltransferase n=1 Tax=Corynebacterium uterequi TaxID=1072256 RepID=A0A0G3HIP1_9CORY|nr:mycothiol synthase [Corynebacterium uterequi]AKK11808.1 mycothiol synthase [Corynebacterium uterequi]
MTIAITYRWVDRPDTAAARDLLSEASNSDGVDAFSEAFVLGLTDARLHHRHVAAEAEGQLVGLAAVAGTDAELVVAPGWRGKGIGRGLLAEVRAAVPEVGVWAHGDLPAAQALAARLSLRPRRTLLVMRLGERELAAADSDVPEGFRVLNLAEAAQRWGRDAIEQAWLTVNNDAFSWHPEQGGWDRDRLHRAQEASWFRDEDVLFLIHGGDDAALSVAGFHWVKVAAPGEAEVYVVGLASAFRGRGLGGPLVGMGLTHMRSRGARSVILYVEADNEAAVRRYESVGFVVAERHVVYRATME